MKREHHPSQSRELSDDGVHRILVELLICRFSSFIGKDAAEALRTPIERYFRDALVMELVQLSDHDFAAVVRRARVENRP
jgi:hypothetical protein